MQIFYFAQPMTEPKPTYATAEPPLTAKELAAVYEMRRLKRTGYRKYMVRDLDDFYMVAPVMPERKAEISGSVAISA